MSQQASAPQAPKPQIIKPRAPAIVTSEAAAAELLARRSAEDSLHEFLKQSWPVIEGGRPFVDNWHLQALCEHLEALYRGDIKNLLANCPPRFSKSTVFNIVFPAWVWIRDPGMQWLFSSYAWTLSLRDSRRCRSLMESRWYRVRWGERFHLLEDANRMDYYNNDKTGYRIATSIDSSTLGLGGDILVGDDLNNTRDQSDTMLQSTIDWWTNVMPTRVNDFKTVRRAVIQQRTSEKDLSAWILEHNDGSWIHFMVPMEFESARRCVTIPLPSTKGKPWQDPRKEDGELLDPKRIGPVELKRLKKDLGSEYAVSGQLQQRPAPTEGGIIKRAWFQIWGEREPPRCEYTVLSIDTALSEKKAAAYNAATTWGVFKDGHGIPNVILLSSWRAKCEYPDLRERIIRMSRDYLDDGPSRDMLRCHHCGSMNVKPAPEMARDYRIPAAQQKHRAYDCGHCHKSFNVLKPPTTDPKRKPDMILVEAKTSGLSLIQDLSRAGIVATKFNPDKLGDKTQRVRIVTPLLEAGRVWLPGVPPDFKRLRPYADVFVNQAIIFPQASSRDLVDTMTQVLWRLSSSGWIWHRDDVGPSEEGYRERPQGAIYG